MDDRRKALKLAATFQFSQITCPGVYLDDRNNELILHIIILGKNYVSPGLNPLFPALINEQFHVEKIFKNCSDPFELGKFLEKEQVIISLLQNFVPVSETAVNLKDFLYNTCHKSIGSNLVREVLITKCKNFPGSLSPKLEFISQTSIREVIAKPKTASIGKLINQHALAGGVQLPLTGKIKQRPQEIIRPRSASPNRAVSNQVKIPKMANNSRPKTGQHIRGRSMSPKKIIKLNKKESNHSNLDQLMVETSVREDENLPGYMKMTVASRSKSPNRKVKPRTRQARLVMTGNEYNSLTKTVKIKDSEAVNNVNRIKEINQHHLRDQDAFASTTDLRTGLLTADNVERLLKSKQAQQIYKSALENAHLDQKLGRLNLEKEINDIKVDFDKSGNSYWTNSNAFKSGRSHRQVFNGLLDDAYTGFYESLESEIS